MADDMDQMLDSLKALADRSRLKILGLLASQEYSVEELAALIELKAPTVSHHLSRLRAAELVCVRTEGNSHLYSLDDRGFDAIRRNLGSKSHVASFAADMELKDWEESVLRNFVNGDVITRIPASRKKRQVILRWLVEFFREGQVYPEKEINEELKRHHRDCATLRREFIASKLMARDKGMYWRLTT